MKKALTSILLSALYLSCLVFSSCGTGTDKYLKYQCYDVNLACMNVDSVQYRGGAHEYDNFEDFATVYNTPKNQSDESFVCAKITYGLPMMTETVYRVLQNPDNLIDVWQDWTVKEARFFLSPKAKEQDRFCRSVVKEAGAVSDERVIDDLKAFAVKNTKNCDCPDDYLSSEYSACAFKSGNSSYSFYMRVLFDQSEDIVWEAEIQAYYLKSQDKYIFTVALNNSEDILDRGRRICIESYPALYEAVAEAAKEYLGDKADDKIDEAAAVDIAQAEVAELRENGYFADKNEVAHDVFKEVTYNADTREWKVYFSPKPEDLRPGAGFFIYVSEQTGQARVAWEGE